MALVFVMILHWLKKATISNFLEDHAPKLEQFVFTHGKVSNVRSTCLVPREYFSLNYRAHLEQNLCIYIQSGQMQKEKVVSSF